MSTSHRHTTADSRKVQTDIVQWVETLVSAIDTTPLQNSERSHERVIWERYCRGGLGLTEDEWKFLAKVGAPQNIPVDLLPTCVPPK